MRYRAPIRYMYKDIFIVCCKKFIIHFDNCEQASEFFLFFKKFIFMKFWIKRIYHFLISNQNEISS